MYPTEPAFNRDPCVGRLRIFNRACMLESPPADTDTGSTHVDLEDPSGVSGPSAPARDTRMTL